MLPLNGYILLSLVWIVIRPLDSDFCRNIIESAKRQKSQPVMKKKPITTEIKRSILDFHNKEGAYSLEDLRIVALCSLAFAGFFCYDE